MLNRGILVWSGSALALALGANTACGQTTTTGSPLQQPGSSAQALSNGLGVPSGPVTSATLLVETLYNSNVAASDVSVANERGLKPGDEITTPSIVVNLARVVLGEVVFLKGNAGYDFYAVNRVLNRERLDLTGGVSASLLTCNEVASAEYKRSQSDLVDITTKAVSNTISTETVRGTVSCGGAMGLAPSITVSNTWRTNSASQQQSADSSLLAVNAGLGYRQPFFGLVSVIGQFEEAAFPHAEYVVDINNPKTVGLLSAGFDLYSTGISYERHIGARLEGAASLTYTWLNQNVSYVPGFRGYTYLLDLRYLVTPRLTAHIDFIRAALPSNESSETFYVDRTYQGDLSYRLTPRINLRLKGYETFRSFGGQGVAVADELNVSEETIRGFGLSCVYSFTPRLSLALDTGREERHANASSLGYSAYHAGLTASARF